MRFCSLLLSFTCTYGYIQGFSKSRQRLSLVRHLSAEDQAEKLLEQARKIREELAVIEGKSLQEVEEEAHDKRQAVKELEKIESDRQIARRIEATNRRGTDGSFLNVPETQEDQVTQAKQAIERAFQDGITRQVVRFALVPEDEALNEDRQWPGGARQMYREAAGPMTRELLRQIKPLNSGEELSLCKPEVKSEDIWDFDGSAMVSASTDDHESYVKAMVLSNTDNKYTLDIEEDCKSMGGDLYLLVNPFWRDVESWGFNILAPKAKQTAQEVIFDGGFQETYMLLQKTVNGEDCIALKAYPYDWQLYVYCETDYWPYNNYLIHLGSTETEPKSSDFSRAMSEREEFALSKNMRQIQRMRGKDE